MYEFYIVDFRIFGEGIHAWDKESIEAAKLWYAPATGLALIARAKLKIMAQAPIIWADSAQDAVEKYLKETQS